MKKKWILKGRKRRSEVKWSEDTYQEAWINNNYNELQHREKEENEIAQPKVYQPEEEESISNGEIRRGKSDSLLNWFATITYHRKNIKAKSERNNWKDLKTKTKQNKKRNNVHTREKN